jgi:8-oxo-dGTP pyrophosphatase MutT (NUDIX family)
MAFELGACVVLWRGDEILVMKRGMGGFAAGGWFIPGGHVEQGEAPHVSAAREVWEETEITVDPESLRITGVMSYETARGTAHNVIYNGECPDGAECVINDEHLVFRWMTPEAFIARFLDGDMLRSKGIDERGVALATEVARVIREAAAKR